MFLYQHTDFKDLLNQVARQMGVRAAIIEKDYWVTLALFHLAHSEFKSEFIFKGGTSLSKAYNLINRYSEDVDLLFIKQPGVKARTRLKAVQEFVSSQSGFSYVEKATDNSSGNDARCSCFDYQKSYSDSLGSILPYIKFEMGYRGGPTPNSEREITSYLADALVKAGEKGSYQDLKSFALRVLAPERTLVEKLYALHSAYESGQIEKKVRHYYDVYFLLGMPEVQKFLGTDEYKILKEDVHQFSIENFPKSPVPKMDELHESKAFQPTLEWKKKISDAHEKSDLIFGKRPSGDEIFQRLQTYLSRF